MVNKTTKRTLSVAIGAAFAVAMMTAPIAKADTNPFGMQNLKTSYREIASNKCAASMKKQTSGKCGAAELKKKEEMKKMEMMKKEGKCGTNKMKKMEKEGKCGANKMKKMEHEG